MIYIIWWFYIPREQIPKLVERAWYIIRKKKIKGLGFHTHYPESVIEIVGKFNKAQITSAYFLEWWEPISTDGEYDLFFELFKHPSLRELQLFSFKQIGTFPYVESEFKMLKTQLEDAEKKFGNVILFNGGYAEEYAYLKKTCGKRKNYKFIEFKKGARL